MKRKFWNWIKNDAGGEEERTLVLNGEISDETWYGDEVTPALFAKELNAGSGNITVWINSPGGDVYAAAQIYNMLMDEYDTVILGFPIWFLKEPNIIKSFMAQYDFAGKIMACFATSHKAGIDKAVSDLKSLCPNAEWKDGILANGDSSAELMKVAHQDGLHYLHL